MKTFFITGTDTHIGKTYVTCTLLKQAQQAGKKAIACKPIASGALKTAEGLRNDDALQFLALNNPPLSYDEINPFIFEAPASPHIAAAREGKKIELNSVIDYCNKLQQYPVDELFIEGVGGWKAPLSDTQTVADWAKALRIPVIVVVGIRLGCLNHALLTLQAIEQDGVPCAGWIANCCDPTHSFQQEDIDTLKTRFLAPHLQTIFYSPSY